jgi:hypothetical protein
MKRNVIIAAAMAMMLAVPLVAYAQLAPAASSELVGALAKELGSTPEQATGAAGALFDTARQKMPASDWAKVSAAVPGMDSLLKAAPGAAAVGTTGAAGAAAGAAGAAAGAAGGLGGAAAAFSKLGLKPDMVAKAIPVLTQYVSKTGGAEVGSLLAGALK